MPLPHFVEHTAQSPHLGSAAKRGRVAPRREKIHIPYASDRVAPLTSTTDNRGAHADVRCAHQAAICATRDHRRCRPWPLAGSAVIEHSSMATACSAPPEELAAPVCGDMAMLSLRGTHDSVWTESAMALQGCQSSARTPVETAQRISASACAAAASACACASAWIWASACSASDGWLCASMGCQHDC